MTVPSLHGRVDAVVIGASAGGVEALGHILPQLTESLRVPVVIVLHLPQQRPSLLVEVFAPKCRCAVREAQDKEPLSAATVYFAPPDYHLLIDQGPALALSADPEVNFSRPSIDVLFESAADVFGPRLAAVVLSGANDDGAEGVRMVRRSGGVVIVQRPDTALARAMVEAAIAAVPPDWVMTVTEIGALLATLDGGDS
jgi:two-component system chemotaxis response regulator CheB